MRKSIATVCLSGTLPDKLEAIAAARFDAVEIFENDLISFSGSPRDLASMAADLGLGIDPADQRLLFEAFYRGRNVDSNAPGNGLGLHLVKRIMFAQGGRVTFNPAPHGGASFTLHIPAAS